ncbi:hypothetical protein G5B46_05105 [Caulobacter sp. 602-2]|uniref:Uncharacterized protein n=1 Tax=Caulobacter sp. 602-2 TaxID=2710887 RepID=A0A6G4QU65_9CAUL|nr:hypothetical protein [Caulobacter sp. 602-2]NGM48979.1 hypothetical protein [Caulobacter sp. 602-2]
MTGLQKLCLSAATAALLALTAFAAVAPRAAPEHVVVSVQDIASRRSVN